MTVKLMSPLGPGASLTATTLTGTYATQTSIVHTSPIGTWAGSGALRTNPAAATGFWTLRGWGATGAQAEMASDTLYTSIALNVASYPLGLIAIAQVLNSAGTSLAHILMTSSGELLLQYFNGSDTQTTIGGLTSPLALNRWYTVEVAILAVSAVGGATVEMRVDGAVVASASSLTVRSTARTIDRCRFGVITSTTADFYWADLVCDDAGYPGNQYVATLTPDAIVTDEWATGTAAGFAPVAEMDGVTAFDSDTSYLGSSTSGNVSTVGLKAITPEFRRITAVMPFAIWRDETGSSVLNLRHISGATSTDLTALDPGATYVMNAAILSNDPNTTAVWTPAAVDAFVVGARNGANVAARVTTLGAYVAFQPYGRMALLGAG